MKLSTTTSFLNNTSVLLMVDTETNRVEVRVFHFDKDSNIIEQATCYHSFTGFIRLSTILEQRLTILDNNPEDKKESRFINKLLSNHDFFELRNMKINLS